MQILQLKYAFQNQNYSSESSEIQDLSEGDDEDFLEQGKIVPNTSVKGV